MSWCSSFRSCPNPIVTSTRTRLAHWRASISTASPSLLKTSSRRMYLCKSYWVPWTFIFILHDLIFISFFATLWFEKVILTWFALFDAVWLNETLAEQYLFNSFFICFEWVITLSAVFKIRMTCDVEWVFCVGY